MFAHLHPAIFISSFFVAELSFSQLAAARVCLSIHEESPKELSDSPIVINGNDRRNI